MFNSARLKKLRKQNRLSQLQMSDRLSISQSSYSKYETGKADLNLELLRRIKEEFGVDPTEFINVNLENIPPNDFFQLDTVINQKEEMFYNVPKQVFDSLLSHHLNIMQLINKVVNQK